MGREDDRKGEVVKSADQNFVASSLDVWGGMAGMVEERKRCKGNAARLLSGRAVS